MKCSIKCKFLLPTHRADRRGCFRIAIPDHDPAWGDFFLNLVSIELFDEDDKVVYQGSIVLDRRRKGRYTLVMSEQKEKAQ